MFRKRHVQIGLLVLTRARNQAFSFYVKDRHVHGYWGDLRRGPGMSHRVEERSLLWLKFHPRTISMVAFHSDLS